MIQVANSISPSASLTMGVQNSRPLELMDGGKGESGGDSSAEFEAYDFPDQGLGLRLDCLYIIYM